jgi:NADH-quinone oxidoreductase subunit N
VNILDHIQESLQYLAPEGMLLLALLAVLFADMFQSTRKNGVFVTILLTCLIAIGFYLTKQLFDRNSIPNVQFMSNMLVQNPVILFSKLLLIISGIIAIVFIQLSPSSQYLRERGETYILFLAIILGCFFLVASVNLFMVFLSLELISVPSYLLVASRMDKKSTEAGMKYLLYGAFATGVMQA